MPLLIWTKGAGKIDKKAFRPVPARIAKHQSLALSEHNQLSQATAQLHLEFVNFTLPGFRFMPSKPKCFSPWSSHALALARRPASPDPRPALVSSRVLQFSSNISTLSLSKRQKIVTWSECYTKEHQSCDSNRSPTKARSMKIYRDNPSLKKTNSSNPMAATCRLSILVTIPEPSVT